MNTSDPYKSEISGIVDLVLKDRDEMLVAVHTERLTYKLLRIPLIGDFNQGDNVTIIISKR